MQIFLSQKQIISEKNQKKIIFRHSRTWQIKKKLYSKSISSRSGEMADTLDSKSGALAGVWVQVPPSVP